MKTSTRIMKYESRVVQSKPVNEQLQYTYCPRFELAVCNSQFAKHFGSLRMSFYIFLKIVNR